MCQDSCYCHDRDSKSTRRLGTRVLNKDVAGTWLVKPCVPMFLRSILYRSISWLKPNREEQETLLCSECILGKEPSLPPLPELAIKTKLCMTFVQS